MDPWALSWSPLMNVKGFQTFQGESLGVHIGSCPGDCAESFVNFGRDFRKKSS